jgi:uncharacterized protein
MTIDMHTHLSLLLEDHDVVDVLSMLDRSNIDGALVMTMTGIFSSCIDHKSENNKVKSLCDRAPERLYPAFTVNPLMGKESLDEVKRCRNELGIKVLKLHPWLQGFSISSPEMRKVAKLCEKLGIVIIFHDGTPPYSTPLQIASLARDFPNLRVVSGHAGLFDLWENAMQAAQRYPNYYLCLCGPTTRAMQKIVDEVPAEQICVGSDMLGSMQDMEDILWYRWQKFRSLKISEDRRRIIEDETPKKLLGL